MSLSLELDWESKTWGDIGVRVPLSLTSAHPASLLWTQNRVVNEKETSLLLSLIDAVTIEGPTMCLIVRLGPGWRDE